MVAALSLVLVAPAAAREPTKAQLPRMVVPDAALARLGSGLRHKYAFFSAAGDAAASTPDPNDTGADLRRLGRIAGYVRGRNATGAFSRRGPKGLQVALTSVILWRDARAASASIRRDISDDERLTGRTIKGSTLVSFEATKVGSLGAGAALLHVRARAKGVTDRFSTEAVFNVGALRGNTLVVRGDGRNADAVTLQLAAQLRRRMLAALGRR